MFKRIAAISLIFIGTTIAWMILGGTLMSRTYNRLPSLRDKVVSNWGGAHTQRPPAACYSTMEPFVKEWTTDGKKNSSTELRPVSHAVPLEGSSVQAAIDLDYRQKGLLWYSTYGVKFQGTYTFRNPAAERQAVQFSFPFPSDQAIYDDLQVTVDGAPAPITALRKNALATASVAANAVVTLGVAYRSRGLENWQYKFGDDVAQVRDFDLRMTTNFSDPDFPEGTLSPTTKRRLEQGWELAWTYRSLMTGQQIGLTMPERLQPGPLAGEISFFAPVSLLFFFFVIFILTTLRGVELHPMNYFFLATAFFAFHLLLAYLVDHISIHAAFVICSLVSMFLVVSYLRLVTGIRFAAVEAGTAQFVYLILFSYAFFFRGFTGLAVTIGAIVTLFIAMQATERIRWGAPPAAR
ncbi:MAG: inner membrane CreD family protein [Acidobacteria bacterium]|nr:inner membrane CreD family protein [Acidobacteriota bacterium]